MDFTVGVIEYSPPQAGYLLPYFAGYLKNDPPFYRFTCIHSLTATVYKPKAKHSCSVVGCTDTLISLHHLRTKEDIRAKWLNFIFQANVPASVSKSVVCANHFTSDCFSNQGQYQAGLATRLFLKDGSIPTVRVNATEEETVSIFKNSVVCVTLAV